MFTDQICRIISKKRSSHAFVHCDSFFDLMGWWVITITFLFFFILGYYHYQLVSEKLEFKQEEIRQWSRFDNPAEKFLAAFGEMENGTILMLIDASKQVRLTLFASKLEEKFSQENVAGEGQTWV